LAAHQRPTRSTYEIRVLGQLDTDWEEWFGGGSVTLGSAAGRTPITILTARLPDQAALRGLLCKLWDLNLTLLSVRRTRAGGGEEEDDG